MINDLSRYKPGDIITSGYFKNKDFNPDMELRWVAVKNEDSFDVFWDLHFFASGTIASKAQRINDITIIKSFGKFSTEILRGYRTR